MPDPSSNAEVEIRIANVPVRDAMNHPFTITRFRGFGDAGEALPWGPTDPEMAAFMRSMDCRRAMLLDGGISSQLAVRRSDGEMKRWKNWRAVPLALVVFPTDR